MEYKSSHREIIKELSNGIHEDKDYDLAIDVKYLAHFLMVNWSRGGVIDSKNSCPNQESDSIYNKHCQIDDDNKIAIYRSPEIKAYALFGSLVNKFKQMVLKVKKIAEEQNRLEFKNNIPCNP